MDEAFSSHAVLIEERELRPSGSGVAVAGSCVASLLILLPLFFGGVHTKTWLVALIAISCSLSWVVFQGAGEIFAAFAPARVFTRFGGLLVLAILMGAVASALFATHLIPGIEGRMPPISGWPLLSFGALSYVAGCFLLYLLTASYLIGRRLSVDRILRSVWLSGLIVSLTALSHWFYDNGKLFWIFEPDSLFVSPRARWPFVNANHLAHFLLPVLFVDFYFVLQPLFALRSSWQEEYVTRKKPIGRVLSRRSFQRELLKLTLASGVCFGTLLTILASLSRASWLGLACATAMLWLLLTRRPPQAGAC